MSSNPSQTLSVTCCARARFSTLAGRNPIKLFTLNMMDIVYQLLVSLERYHFYLFHVNKN